MPRRVAVVVLGDLGHSPRMQYHCSSLARNGFDVDFVGYKGSAPHESILSNERIHIRYLADCPRFPVAVLNLIFKLIWQTATLLYTLLKLPGVNRPDLILVQNPPGLPAVFVCWLVIKIWSLFSREANCRLLIDWHNYTYSIFALRYGDNLFVKAVRFYEFSVGRYLACGGFCVSEAMRKDLYSKDILHVKTHYDRPNENFRPFDDDGQEKQEFLTNLAQALPEFDPILNQTDDQRKTALVISSTSWTPDENFDLLFDALKLYDDESLTNEKLPNLLVTITGKGPLKQHYVRKVKDYGYHHVTVVTPWLKAEDYPKLLACADLGVSLHYSSSGLDLPMKVVDMHGCGVPVVSVKFPCVEELVEKQNLFDPENPKNLAELFMLLLMHFPRNDSLSAAKFRRLKELKEKPRWDEAWDNNVLPYISHIIDGNAYNTN